MLNLLKEIYYFFRIDALLTVAIILSLVGFLLGYANHDKLPVPSEIMPELDKEPTQIIKPSTLTTTHYMGTPYQIKEIADYEISGLVVSHNNINSLFDTYHDKESIDTKDLCVIWGENVKNRNYLSATFKSGPWTCYYTPARGKPISSRQLSNNHLITKDETIRDAIAKVSIGDQIRISGKLVNYKGPGWKEWRRTSVSRADMGGHSCEVVLVEKLETLKKSPPLWDIIYFWSQWVLGIALLLRMGIYFLF